MLDNFDYQHSDWSNIIILLRVTQSELAVGSIFILSYVLGKLFFNTNLTGLFYNARNGFSKFLNKHFIYVKHTLYFFYLSLGSRAILFWCNKKIIENLNRNALTFLRVKLPFENIMEEICYTSRLGLIIKRQFLLAP